MHSFRAACVCHLAENIIRMFDYFETDREFCVVTEFAQGEPISGAVLSVA